MSASSNRDIKFIVVIAILSVIILIQIFAVFKLKRELMLLNFGLLNIEREQYYYHLTDFENNEKIEVLPEGRLLQKGQHISIDDKVYEVILIKDKYAKGDDSSGDQLKITSLKHKGVEVLVKFQGNSDTAKKK